VVDTLSATDPDPGDSVSFSLVPGALDDDLFTFVGHQLRTESVLDHETKPEPQLRIKLTDTHGASTLVDTFVTVTDTNDAPVAGDDQVSTDKNTAVSVLLATMLANDTDQDSDPLHVAAVSDPVGGTADLQPADDRVLFTPTTDFCGSGGFDYTVVDNSGATNDSDVGHVSVTVLCPNLNPPSGVVQRDHDVTGNVAVSVAAGALVAGVSDPDGNSVHMVPDSGTTGQGGSYQVNDDASWSYLPPAGFEGIDSFPYQVCDDGIPDLCSSSTVHLTVTGSIWFVDNGAAVPGDGRLTSPFQSLAAFQAVNDGIGTHPAPGDTASLDRSTATPYVGPVTLLAGQRMVGKGVAADLPAYAGVTLAPDSLPLPAPGPSPVVTSATDAVVLGTDNTLAGFDIGDRGDTGAAVSGSSFGTLSIGEMSIRGKGMSLFLIDGVLAPGSGLKSVTSANGPYGLALALVSGDLTIPAGDLHATDVGLLVTGGSVTLSYAGAVTGGFQTAGVRLSSRSSGTVTLSGPISVTSGGGISIQNCANAAPTVLSGPVDVSVTDGRAFDAVNGGTIAVTNGTHDLATTTGIALNVVNTSIAAAGLTFRSISSNGASSGIVVNGTGNPATTGSLTVTGAGTAGSGGTITGSVGAGISLAGTKAPSFSFMAVQNSGSDGVAMSGSTGTLALTSSTVTGSGGNNVSVTAGSTTGVQISGSTLSATKATTGGDGLHVLVNGASNLALTVTGSTFTDNHDDQVSVVADGTYTGNSTVNLSGNTLTAASTSTGSGIAITTSGTGELGFTVAQNGIKKSHLAAVAVGLADGAPAGALLQVTITGNTVGDAALAGSGSATASGLAVHGNGAGALRVVVSNNLVRRYNLFGIEVSPRPGSGPVDVTATGNTVSNPDVLALNGFYGAAGATPGDAGTLCLALSGNDLSNGGNEPSGATDFRVRQLFNTTFRLPGYAGTPTDTAAVVSFLQVNNIGSETGSATGSGAGGGFVGGGACAQPS
jgi:hypothetical protein